MTVFSRVRQQLLDRTLQALDPRRRRILAWRALSLADVRSLTFERDGIIWNVPGLDAHTGFDLFVEGGSQDTELRALLEWVRHRGLLSGSRDVMLDVGANLGTTCIPFARATGHRVVAIEPVADTFRYLRLNVEANGLQDRIVTINRAVVNTPGLVTMCLLRNHTGGAFVLREASQESGANPPTDAVEGQESVVGDTLSAILAAAGVAASEVALVWADVQGSEADVMTSGASLWQLGVPLWAEIEPLSLRRQGMLDQFAQVAARHFDRFVRSAALLKNGAAAAAEPIAMLQTLIDSVTPAQLHTDVLLLPPSLSVD
jgi:FkbM family methyltransferase